MISGGPTTSGGGAGAGGGLTQAVERLERFDGPREAFLQHLLQLQCGMVGALGGAMLKPGEENQVGVLACIPPADQKKTPPMWLSQAAQQLGAGPWPEQMRVVDITAPAATQNPRNPHLFLLILPVPQLAKARAVTVLVIPAAHAGAVRVFAQQIELSFHLINSFEMRRTLHQRKRDLDGLKTIVEVQQAVGEPRHFQASAMALCNELTTRYELERASVGVLRGRHIKLVAMSQTEHINRRMTLVQRIEAAMEESLDQDSELVYPSSEEAPVAVRMTQQLANEFGPSAVCSLPIRRGDAVEGVITLERPAERLFTLDELRQLRIMVDLITPRLVERFEQDRWFGARLADSTRRTLALAVGPQYTYVKLAAIALLGLLAFMIFVKGPDRVEAPFTIETITKQVVPAPYDGFIKHVNVEPGDRVAADQTVLATLDTQELEAKLAELRAQWATHRKEADIARQERKESQVQIADARAQQVRSQMDSVMLQLSQAQLVSPQAGIVIAGDLKSKLGAPVSRGDVLFEVAPPESLRAELHVPDRRIGDVRVGDQGELATASHPDQPIHFVVEQIFPVAEVIDDHNVFRVKVRLDASEPWVFPGVEGVAKVDVGRQPYGVLWTRDAWNWVRMQLWI